MRCRFHLGCSRVEAPLPGNISSCGVPGGIVLRRNLTTDLNKLSWCSCVEVLPTDHSLSSMMDSPSYDFAFRARGASCIQVLYECTRAGFEASSQGPLTPISLSGGSLTLVLRNLTFSHQTTLDLWRAPPRPGPPAHVVLPSVRSGRAPSPRAPSHGDAPRSGPSIALARNHRKQAQRHPRTRRRSKVRPHSTYDVLAPAVTGSRGLSSSDPDNDHDSARRDDIGAPRSGGAAGGARPHRGSGGPTV